MVTFPNKKNHIYVVWWLIGILLLSACRDDELLPAIGGSTGNGIVRFKATLSSDAENKETRGVPVSGTVYPDGASFGVLGYTLPQGVWDSSLRPDFMYNRKVTRQGDRFSYEGTEYWPGTSVRFFAYHPYASADNGITLSAADVSGSPSISFVVKEAVTEQVDLLLAAPDAALAPPDVVFPFRHALTRVAFRVRKQGIAAEVKVFSVVMKNVIGAGTVLLAPATGGHFAWLPSERFEDVKEYQLDIPTTDGTDRGLLPFDEQEITETEYRDVCSANGTLFLIPQQITTGRSLLIVRYTVNGQEKVKELLLPATAPGSADEWVSGKFLRYQLTLSDIDAVEEVTVSVDDANANCILLDPTPQTNLSADFVEYSIPIVQANHFYTDPAFAPWNEGIAGISETDLWGVNVIWMDKANLISITKNNGSGANDTPDGRFKVRIPVGNEGNALVGIYKDTNGNGVKDTNEEWFWSWHLWVTNYNPNRLLSADAPTVNSAEGEWEVAAGKVHRYRNASVWINPEFNNGEYGALDIWTPGTGLYAGKVMMDRNVGSVSSSFPPLENNIPFQSADVQQRKAPLHVLYYEYGRKDPFLSDAYRYQENGTALNTIDFYNQQVTLLYCIQNPEKYIYGRQSWATNKPVGCYWYDPRHEATPERSDNTGKKSLFDPCPAGWRLPVNGTWNDFSPTTFSWSTPLLGRTYTPDGSTLQVYYPAEGFRVASTGEVKQTGYHGIYWTCSPIPANARDYCFRFSSPEDNILEGNVLVNTIRPSAAVYQTDSFSVRCVQE